MSNLNGNIRVVWSLYGQEGTNKREERSKRNRKHIETSRIEVVGEKKGRQVPAPVYQSKRISLLHDDDGLYNSRGSLGAESCNSAITSMWEGEGEQLADCIRETYLWPKGENNCQVRE